MRIITAIIRPDKLDDVIRAVSGIGAGGLTVTEARGFGRQFGCLGAAEPGASKALVLPKLRIDVLVHDESSEFVTDAIAKSVGTGSIGDGKIWVCPVDSALRIRTGERDEAAV